MSATHRQMKILAHTARMLQYAEQRPDHNKATRKDHDRTIAAYRAEWDQISPDDRDDIVEAVKNHVDGLTPELITDARAELEN